MEIKHLYVYPIKSLRGASLDSAILTPQGFPYDRRFMLLRYHKDGKPSQESCYENMAVAKYPAMCLFTTSLSVPAEDDPSGGHVEVTHTNPDDDSKDTLNVPLHPDPDSLEILDVSMHQSQTNGYDMGSKYNDWFSEHFGFDVVLAYLGQNRRTVLGNLAPNAATANPPRQKQLEQSANNAKSWLSSHSKAVWGSNSENEDGDDYYKIGFADVSPYLIISATSVDEVSNRLPGDETMDHTKFRPNIVVSGAPEAFEEDYWKELTITSGSGDVETKLVLTANCLRCASLNVNYDTGKATGDVLKRLQNDRRIDTGHKYGPAFGRYGFLTKDSEVLAGPLGVEVKVGDDVQLTEKYGERTVFRWPGIGQTKVGERWAC